MSALAAPDALDAAQSRALAERINVFLAARDAHRRPPERLALAWNEIDALETLGVLDWIRPPGAFPFEPATAGEVDWRRLESPLQESQPMAEHLRIVRELRRYLAHMGPRSTPIAIPQAQMDQLEKYHAIELRDGRYFFEGQELRIHRGD